MPTAVVLAVTFLVVIFGFFAVLFTALGVRDRRRRQRREERGVRTGATVASVEPMVPPTVTAGTITHTWSEFRRSSGDDGPSGATVHPYSVRFALPDGRHVHRRAPDTPKFDRNRPGQQVRVAYQPEEPGSFTVGPLRRVLLSPVLVILFGAAFVGVGVLLAALA
ncbi:DUF3592 domain-containing protein [Halostreptopolyspora alba]|uniref:DUF3592 domain-containing protein n=1 Tax=Halostreptopolyspora alba TaxID=2487137 RepID=A0A3N0E4S2_9ACTN|nr:DUF3592 domain-containing protein [Nocardiopsaceae bacterium YIM 96095]